MFAKRSVLHNQNQIVNQLAQGDEAAFDQIFYEYYDELCHYAMRYVPDQLDAEGLVQNSLVKLWDRREKASEIKSIKAYLYRSVYNACLNFLEHEKVKKQYVSDTEFSLRAIELEAYESTYNFDLAGEMESAINELPPKNQEVFRKRYYEGLRHKEIAEELGISERTVEAHIAKSMRLLRDKLKYLLLFIISVNFFDFF